MPQTHQEFIQAEIAKDPQIVARKKRQKARWRTDFYRFGREKDDQTEGLKLGHIALLGYN